MEETIQSLSYTIEALLNCSENVEVFHCEATRKVYEHYVVRCLAPPNNNNQWNVSFTINGEPEYAEIQVYTDSVYINGSGVKCNIYDLFLERLQAATEQTTTAKLMESLGKIQVMMKIERQVKTAKLLSE